MSGDGPLNSMNRPLMDAPVPTTLQQGIAGRHSTGENFPSVTLLAAIPYLFFLLANIYDMGGTHGLKYISYGVLSLLIFFARRPLHLRAHEELGIAALFLAWPAFSLWLGLHNGADFGGDYGAISQATPFLGFFVPLLVAPALGARKALELLYYALITVAVAIVILTPLEYTGWGMSIVTQVPNYVTAIYLPFHGGIMEHRLYFQATLWLVPAAVYFARISRFGLTMLCLAGLIMASSRGGALIAFAFILWILFRSRKSRAFGVLSIALGIGIALYFLPTFVASTRSAVLESDSSDWFKRIGHAVSVMQIFHDKPWTFFIGTGAGGAFYSNGTGAWEVRMETDQLDAIFHYGVIWFAAFTGLCVWAARKLLRSTETACKAHGLALVSMYLASTTNPQLISPLFMFYAGCCYLLARQLPVRAAQREPRLRWNGGMKGARMRPPLEGMETP